MVAVCQVVVTDRSPLAVSNALSNAKNLAGYLGGVQGVVCKAPSTDLLGEQFDMVYIDYCSRLLLLHSQPFVGLHEWLCV